MSSVTAIIPTYNRANFLDKAITSIIKQTDVVKEVIVVDDGSTDNTREIIKTIKEKHDFITYSYQENRGPAAARNKGICLADSDFIAFLDSDDTWHRKKIELQSGQLNKNTTYLVSHTGEKWLRNGVHLNQKKKHLQKHGDIFFQNLKLCAAGMSTIMVRREIFDVYGLFDEDLPCCEDYEFWLRIGGKENFLLIDRALTVKHGGRDDQVSAIHRQGMDVFRILALEKLIKTYVFSPQKRLALIKECKRRCAIYIKGCEKHNRRCEAERYRSKLQWLERLNELHCRNEST